MPIRVLLADDDARFRAALRERLEEDARFEVVGESATGHGLTALVSQLGADVVILDVRMPGGGAEAAAALRDPTAPGRPVVVGLSSQSGASTVAAMVAAGATGFLTKGRASDRLPDLIARCAAGEVVLPSTVGD